MRAGCVLPSTIVDLDSLPVLLPITTQSPAGVVVAMSRTVVTESSTASGRNVHIKAAKKKITGMYRN